MKEGQYKCLTNFEYMIAFNLVIYSSKFFMLYKINNLYPKIIQSFIKQQSTQNKNW